MLRGGFAFEGEETVRWPAVGEPFSCPDCWGVDSDKEGIPMISLRLLNAFEVLVLCSFVVA